MQFKQILLLFSVIFAHNACANLDESVETTATFSISSEAVTNKHLDNKVVQDLIKATKSNKKKLVDSQGKTLLNKEGKILLFTIKYSTIEPLNDDVSTKTITQHGLYNNLDKIIKSRMTGAKTAPQHIKILYKKNDPLSICFLIDGVSYKAPILVSDTILP